jgi:hypothetical protein
MRRVIDGERVIQARRMRVQSTNRAIGARRTI